MTSINLTFNSVDHDNRKASLVIVHIRQDQTMESRILGARLRISEFAHSHSLDDLLQITLDEAELLTQSNIGFFHFVEKDQKNLSLQNWSTRVHEAMPQVLANCGYRNAVFYPLDRNFVGNGPFYTSIGMHNIFDRAAQGLKAYVQRDNVYYNNALDYIGQSLSEARTPLFVFLLTSSGHQPYTSALSPDTNVQGGAPGIDPIVNEYLRRQSMARLDLETFRAELKSRFPHESFLIVQYGDHQPYFTRQFPELRNKPVNDTGNDVSSMLSYYAVEGINFTPPPLPDMEIRRF